MFKWKILQSRIDHFNTIIKDETKAYFSIWCGHCQTLKPIDGAVKKTKEHYTVSDSVMETEKVGDEEFRFSTIIKKNGKLSHSIKIEHRRTTERSR